MSGALRQAGMQALVGELEGASADSVTRLVASFGQRLAPGGRGRESR